MNSKAIIRKTLPLIIALVVIIIVAVSCTIFSKEKSVPWISNSDDDYFTKGNIVIKNNEMYSELRNQKGIATLVSMVDEYLLSVTKNANDVSYLDAVTAQEIADEIETAIFPNGRTGVVADDDKTITDWEQSMFLGQGLRNQDEIDDYYRLVLAKEAYTRDELVKAYEESISNNDEDDEDTFEDDTITAEDIEKYYDSNYTTSYWTVIINYSTLNEAKVALSQLGIEIGKNASDQACWVWGATDVALTAEEIKQAFIDLYNNKFSYKVSGYPNADPNDNQYLGSDQYQTVAGEIIFNTTLDSDEDSLKNLFYYTNAELTAITSSTTSGMVPYIKGLDAYNSDNAELLKTYSVNPKSFSGSYYLVFKIDYVDPVAQDAVADEIIEKIIDSKVTAAAIGAEMGELRAEHQFTIYDSKFETNYKGTYYTSHVTTKKESKTDVASLSDKTFTADELFAKLSRLYGLLASVDFFTREYLLYSEYNTIYQYNGPDTKGTVLDADEWKDIEDQVADIKENFKANGYYESGYGVSYGWENFLRDYYKVDNTDELKLYFLRQEIVSNYKDAITDVETIWDTIYSPKMNETYNDFLSANGMHLLIYKTDEDGKNVDPVDWTVYETQVAEELYDNVLNRLATTMPSKFSSLLSTTIVEEYNNAPRFVATLAQDAASQPVWSAATDWVLVDSEDYLYSKAKTLNFQIKYEALTTTAGVMVDPFEDAVREIWDNALTTNTFGEDIVIYDKTFANYLVTEFGYHVYVNTSTTNRATVSVSGTDQVAPIPTKEQVLLYVENDATTALTTLIKKGITTYFSPIRTELTGNYYYSIRLFETLRDISDEVVFADNTLNTNDEFASIFQYQIDTYYKQLRYVENPADSD